MKQVIVLRKDLNMRKGKMVAQGAHASMKAVLDEGYVLPSGVTKPHDYFTIPMTCELEQWLTGLFTKVCVGVDSEEELLGIYEKAKAAELHCSLIQDAGLTEFKEPTYTAVAVGPGEPEEVDKVTGHLKLL